MPHSDCFPSRKVLANVAAPMVNQSDLPLRKLVRRYDATLVYTQMLLPERLLGDQEYLDFHLRGLGGPGDRPVVVQLCGNDPETVVKAARKLQGHNTSCADLNLGCPQETARDAHHGAYLLGQKDWPLVQSIVSSRSHSLIVPVSAKLRLCQSASATLDLAQRLENVGTSWITLHARTVSTRRRRQGAADLEQVKRLKENLTIPVVSNGNVRVWKDVEANRAVTGADGMMVGETLLGNPCLFANVLPDPVDISREYLDLCREDPGTATIQTVRTHVRHFIDHQCSRRPWLNKFRAELTQCESLEDIEYTLRKVQRWRDFSPSAADPAVEAEECEEEHEKTVDDVLDAIALFRN
ncbi:FMN-linked oxidoreductase [Laetiporus sulphureus 93-53]|uniref:tRNA-dihydrouridine synthase n=1 Tax=Laetiporus sulphureus 93-53 TaxID=1314785 RepID=A0A165BHK0_9APHY|nr:FMN-linked oxidoreductase [Laetiporus sulphureus 93-53]KZT01069.1 FMN-linked oxidoreductase [Laetiporus sulphureus 93-53]